MRLIKMLNNQGALLSYILLACALTACKGGASSVGLPSVTISGDGIGYSPTGNGGGGNGPSAGSLIPTNRDILGNTIGTSSSGNGLNYRAAMSGTGGGAGGLWINRRGNYW